MPVGLVTLSSVMKSPMTFDSSKQQTPVAKHWANLLADPDVTIRERPDLCPSTCGQIAAVVALGRGFGPKP